MTGARYNAFRDHAELLAYDDVEWADPGMALPGSNVWPRAEVAPAPGVQTLVRVHAGRRHASVGDERWLLFLPAMAALNGWDEYPAAISGSAFVRCRVRAVEAGGPAGDHWLRVDIAEVVPFGILDARFAARPLSRLETWRLSTGALTRHEDWELWFAPHDDAGYWLLARLAQDEAHVVAAGEWLHAGNTGHHEAWAGHVVLPLAAWRQICQRC